MEVGEFSKLVAESKRTVIGEKVFRVIRKGLSDAPVGNKTWINMSLSKDMFLGLLAEGGQVVDVNSHNGVSQFRIAPLSVTKMGDNFDFAYQFVKSIN